MSRHKRDDWQDRFIAVYEESCVVTIAAKAAGVSRRTVQRARISDQDFATRFAEAQRVALARLEEVAFDRAIDHSDTLMIFLLKANNPGKYRESLNVRHGGTVKVESDVDAEIRELLGDMDRREQAEVARGGEGQAVAANGQHRADGAAG